MGIHRFFSPMRYNAFQTGRRRRTCNVFKANRPICWMQRHTTINHIPQRHKHTRDTFRCASTFPGTINAKLSQIFSHHHHMPFSPAYCYPAISLQLAFVFRFLFLFCFGRGKAVLISNVWKCSNSKGEWAPIPTVALGCTPRFGSVCSQCFLQKLRFLSIAFNTVTGSRVCSVTHVTPDSARKKFYRREPKIVQLLQITRILRMFAHRTGWRVGLTLS